MPLSNDQRERLTDLVERAVPYPTIAEVLGITADSARGLARRMGLRWGCPAPTGLAARLQRLPQFPDNAHCCWPYGEPVRFCGSPVPRLGVPYCKEHQKRAWTRDRERDAKSSRR